MQAYIDGDSEGFTPEEFADVMLCLQTLFSVRAGSQPLDRDFGLDYDGTVGAPLPEAENRLSVEIYQKVERYEPRAEVDNITFTSSSEGLLVPHVHFIKGDGEEE